MRRGMRRGPRRRIRTGSAFALTETSLTVASTLFDAFWVKVPGGVVDTSANPNGDREPTNDTLVRTQIQLFANNSGVTSALRTGLSIAFGLIAWDGIDELPPSELPDPENGFFEWIYRQHAIDPYPSPLVNSPGRIYNMTTTDMLLHSKGQRKLPEGTGLLCVVSARWLEGLAATSLYQQGVSVRYWVKES